jgi:hypothetical protein
VGCPVLFGVAKVKAFYFIRQTFLKFFEAFLLLFSLPVNPGKNCFIKLQNRLFACRSLWSGGQR